MKKTLLACLAVLLLGVSIVCALDVRLRIGAGRICAVGLEYPTRFTFDNDIAGATTNTWYALEVSIDNRGTNTIWCGINCTTNELIDLIASNMAIPIASTRIYTVNKSVRNEKIRSVCLASTNLAQTSTVHVAAQ